MRWIVVVGPPTGWQFLGVAEQPPGEGLAAIRDVARPEHAGMRLTAIPWDARAVSADVGVPVEVAAVEVQAVAE